MPARPVAGGREGGAISTRPPPAPPPFGGPGGPARGPPRHAQLRGPGKPPPELRRHLRIGEVAEGVRDRSRRDSLHDPRVPVPERRDAEAAREVEVLAPARVPDAAPLGAGPDHRDTA